MLRLVQGGHAGAMGSTPAMQVILLKYCRVCVRAFIVCMCNLK